MNIRNKFLGAVFVFTILFSIEIRADELRALSARKIGVILPLAGSLSVFGGKVREGIELAVAKTPGAPKLIFEDAQFDKALVLSAFRKLVDIDGVEEILGPFGPDQTFAIASQARERRVLLVTVSLCEPRFRELSNVFCTYPSPDQQINPLLARFSRGRMEGKISTVAVYAEELEGFEAYRKAITKFIAANGYQALAQESFVPSSTDFRSQLLKLKGHSPDLLIIAGASAESVVTLLKQARDLGIRPKFKWYLSEHDAELFEKNRELLEGAYLSGVPKLSEEFRKEFQSRYGREPDLYQALGYDAARYLITAYQSEPGKSGVWLTPKLISMKLEHNAASGFHFTKDRAVSAQIVLSRIVNGKQVFEPESTAGAK